MFDAGGENLPDDRRAFGGHAIPQAGPPLVAQVPPGLEEVGRIQSATRVVEFGMPQSVVADGPEQRKVVDAFPGEKLGGGGAVQNRSRKVPQGWIQQFAEGVGGSALQRVVQEAHRHPAITLVGIEAGDLRPLLEEFSDPPHMCQSLAVDVRPRWQIALARRHDDGMKRGHVGEAAEEEGSERPGVGAAPTMLS